MKEQISLDIKAAMKSKDAERLSTLRMILADIQRKEKEKGLAVTDETVVQILQSMVRKRKEAIEQFRKGGRDELAEKEQREIAVIEGYLPEQLSEDDISDAAREAITALGVSGPREMGKVMGVLVKKLGGRADGGTISRIVKAELQKLDQ